MCVVALAWKAHPRWPLVLIGNRDEFHGRPSAAIARWPEAQHLIAGRDLKSGGTWLGISEEGRLAVVTNVAGEGPPDPDKASRGALVADFLSGREADSPADGFNPFNLIRIQGDEAHLASNRPKPLEMLLQPGIHSLSNGTVDSPWPRKAKLEAAMRAQMAAGLDPYELMALLADEAPSDDGGPIFISDGIYGTRCSSLILVDHEGKGLFLEQSFGANGLPLHKQQIDFRWSA